MTYTNLIRKVKKLTGADVGESKDALGVVVENIAVNLTSHTRQNFAARLPHELRDFATTEPTLTQLDDDMVSQLMDIDDVDETQAKRRLRAAWSAILEQFDEESTEDLISELPRQLTTEFR